MKKRKTIRLQGFDYSLPGGYFVTMVVQDRLHLFGEIINGEMINNNAGNMIRKWYSELENKFPTVKCHEYIIMPDHFHCLIEIRNKNNLVGADLCIGPDGNPIPHLKPTKHTSPTLSHIIQWFKTMTTNDYIKGVKNHHWDKFNNKLWERSFIDRILRKNEIDIKREYIKNNPKNWGK